MKKLAIALLAVAAVGVVPAGADHAAACQDQWICDSQGTVWETEVSVKNGDETITVRTSLQEEERISSQGHTTTHKPMVRIDRFTPGLLGSVCFAPAEAITYEASDVIHVISVAEGCSLDLTWTGSGVEGAGADRRTDLSPGIPTVATTTVTAAAGLTLRFTADVEGTVGGTEIRSSEGKTRRHEYIGHVTLIR